MVSMLAGQGAYHERTREVQRVHMGEESWVTLQGALAFSEVATVTCLGGRSRMGASGVV